MDSYTLIQKVIHGTASEKERRKVQHWIAESNANLEEFEALKFLMTSPPTDSKEFNYHPIQVAIHQQIRTRKQNAFKRISAVFVTLIVIVIAVIIWIPKPPTPSSITFNQTTLKKVFEVLANRYHVTIDIENPTLQDCTFTGAFSTHETLSEMLATITRASNVTIKDFHPHYLIEGTCNSKTKPTLFKSTQGS
jgi:ferric-dicitrate binding protein FerR (iron transport regulator)